MEASVHREKQAGTLCQFQELEKEYRMGCTIGMSTLSLVVALQHPLVACF
jgi:hypothetical protein